MAFLVPCLTELRAEFNDLSPRRDKGADGWIGDVAHLARTSDHNVDPQGRVLALDIDSTGPWPQGLTFDRIVQSVIDRCRSGKETRIEYVIWDHHIYSRSDGFTKRVYTGSTDPHVNHAHFSARHDHHGEADTRGWNLLALLEDDMPTLAEVQAAAKAGFISALSDAYTAAMGRASGDTPDDKAKRNVRDFLRAVVGGPIADVDEGAIAAAVLAGLNPAAIAAAIPAELADQVASELAARLAA